MKRYILFSLLALLVFGSCEKDEFGPVLNIGDQPVITSPADGTSLVLTEDNGSAAFPEIAWSGADFGFQAGVAYTVEIAAAGTDFAEPMTLGVVNALQLDDLTNEEVNSMLLANEFVGEAPASLELRIAAKVNPDVEAVYSEPLTMSITPYTVEIDYPKLHVPGSYQGWNEKDESTVIYSLRSDDKYEGYLYFADDNVEYKFTDGPSWDTNWGDTGADGTLDPGGDNIVSGTAGMYRLNVDLTTGTYTAVKTDWGVIGDATPGGWENDTDLVYDETSGTLKATLDLTAGGFIKFRANDNWDINMGDDDANGDLQYGGADIAIDESGNYTIELILNQARYLYKLTKN